MLPNATLTFCSEASGVCYLVEANVSLFAQLSSLYRVLVVGQGTLLLGHSEELDKSVLHRRKVTIEFPQQSHWILLLYSWTSVFVDSISKDSTNYEILFSWAYGSCVYTEHIQSFCHYSLNHLFTYKLYINR